MKGQYRTSEPEELHVVLQFEHHGNVHDAMDGVDESGVEPGQSGEGVMWVLSILVARAETTFASSPLM